MNIQTVLPERSEQEEGRHAAQKLCVSWPDASWIPDQPSLPWAQGAIQAFSEIICQQHAIFRASQRGAEIGASMLSPRLFQGLSESLQNADDLEATELRIVLRRQPRRELLLIHNGKPVSLAHVGAMVLPWLSTKAGDEQASGRFGIGQKTLKALGGPLEMHCAPFHFVMLDDAPAWTDPATAIVGLYHPNARDTMLIVPLDNKIKDGELYEAMSSLGVESLIFLRHIRCLSFADLDAPERSCIFSIDAGPMRKAELRIGTEMRTVRHDTLEITSPIESKGITFERYWTEQPVRRNLARLNKATGKFTTLGICVCSDQSRAGALHDRIPLPITIDAPIRLNAQFDPDGARSNILKNQWNKELLADLGQFLGAVALDALGRDASSAWMHVPLSSEPIVADEWVRKKYVEAVVGACHARLIADLRLPTAAGDVPLPHIVYEEDDIESLVTTSDLELLASGYSAILPDCLDEHGRWREVLDDLGQSRSLGPGDALELFDHLEQIKGREPDWYVAMAALAIDHGLWTAFSQKKAILLADRRIVVCPAKNGPRVLVRIDDPQSLAARLGLALPLHAAYMAESTQAIKVVSKLSEVKALRDSCDQPVEALQLLSRSNEAIEEPHRIVDNDILALRDAWAHLTRDQQRDMSAKIGSNIALRTIVYQKGSQRPLKSWARPCEAYLPAAIDRETDSFAKVAERTPGLVWVDPDYAKLLKHDRGRSEAGPQRFLVALGVSRDPRLTEPANQIVKWARDTRPASPVLGVDRPAAQLSAIRSGKYVDHLLDDRWSPDLDAVVIDIQASPTKMKRKRALALLAVLNRGWERRYAEHQTAKAVYGSYGNWIAVKEIQATWLARLASSAWLPNGNGALRAPSDLALPTDANRLSHGTDRSVYLITKIDLKSVRTDLLKALGIRLGPSGDDLVSQLKHLRDQPITAEIREQVHSVYHLLAADLQTNAAEIKAGRAMTPQRLRNEFRASPGRAGLLLAGDQWLSPEAVLRGPPIFGGLRAFAPHIAGLEPLWATLDIPTPTANDCVGVLRELARRPSLTSSNQGVMLLTLRELANLVEDASPQLRAAMRRLPLWTGAAWSTARPMYVLDGEAIAHADIGDLNVWRPGLTSFADLCSLFPVLDLTHLRLEDFLPSSLSSAGVAEGESKRKIFAEVVMLLNDELIRNDIGLHESLSCTWNELLGSRLIIDPALEITVQLEGRSAVRLPARAHMMRRPLTFIVRSLENAEASEAGGQAIASLFRGDRQKLAWAWASVWRRACSGEEASQIVLPSTKPEAANTVARLANLQAQANDRGERRSKSSKPGSAIPNNKSLPTIQVRQLRDIEELEPTKGAIVNAGASNNGVVFVKSRVKGQAGRIFDTGSKVGTTPSRPPTRTVLPPTSDREQLALEAVKRALRLDPKQIQDVRERRGIGVDAIDELHQCYEIKMSSSPAFPADVTLTPSEVEAAQNDPDFFLAVVAGLEAGDGCLKVRFIFRPLEHLAAKIRGEVTLTGVDKAEALEYEFPAMGKSGDS
jgi:hypothetical protein